MIVERYTRNGKTMAPYIPVPGVMQANVRFTLAGQQIENCLCFRYGDGVFLDAVPAIDSVLETYWWATLRETLSNQIAHVETYYVDLASVSGFTSTSAAYTPNTGASAIFSAPNNVAICVSHRTANRGRSFRGRTYISGIPSDQQSLSRLSPGAMDTVLDAFTQLITQSNVAGYPFVVVSKRSGGLPRAIGLSTPVTQSVIVDNVLDSQRRRLPGRGS